MARDPSVGASDLRPEGEPKPLTKSEKRRLMELQNPKGEPGHCPECGANEDEQWSDDEQIGCDVCGFCWPKK